MPLRSRKAKNPPILSHEFVIQNHADIVGVVAVLFVGGMLFQVSAPLTQPFVLLQYNSTGAEEPVGPITYGVGPKDLLAVFFYSLITIIVHQCIQEYILDKINRKLHLSKVKHSKFNESGQQLAFCAVAAVWASYIIYEEGYLMVLSSLWEGYPSVGMRFWLKMFFIIQICYWLHVFPEFYFQKVKKDEIAARTTYALLHLAFIVPAYIMNFHRLALVLLNAHYISEGILHMSRLLHFMDKKSAASAGFAMWNVVFGVVRIVTVILSGLTFLYGLQKLSDQSLNVFSGNYNTPLIRNLSFLAVALIQLYMVWNFFTFHVQRKREQQKLAASSVSKRASGKKHLGAGDTQANGKKKN